MELQGFVVSSSLLLPLKLESFYFGFIGRTHYGSIRTSKSEALSSLSILSIAISRS